MARVVLAFGSNLGNRTKNIEKAISLLKKFGLQLEKLSSFYLTKPFGFPFQPSFINAVGSFLTSLSPYQILTLIKKIEGKFYRLRLFKNAPRFLDIDILFYNSQIIVDKDLKIPHPKILERDFVLLPLLEIIPDFYHPQAQRQIKDLVRNINSQNIKIWKKLNISR
jgi:2-amino-4-hydroxy-6-hydroxymethyldihydropteridine diphosphokinase